MGQAESAFMQLCKPVVVAQLLMTKKGGKGKGNQAWWKGRKVSGTIPAMGFSEKIE